MLRELTVFYFSEYDCSFLIYDNITNESGYHCKSQCIPWNATKDLNNYGPISYKDNYDIPYKSLCQGLNVKNCAQKYKSIPYKLKSLWVSLIYYTYKSRKKTFLF